MGRMDPRTAANVQVIAHRGASKLERENTLEAFRRAAAVGADAVELDVRRTADGALVVHHNPTLDDGRVIAGLHRGDLPADVPSLTDALEACAGMWVNVEIKNDPDEPDFDPTEMIADQTVDVLASLGDDQRWVISSFRIETIDRCRALAPAIRTAWLTYQPAMEADQRDVGQIVRRLVARGHAAWHPWVGTLTEAEIGACHDAGVVVNTWTCDDPARMRELIGWGIDGICTNVPDVAATLR